MKKFSGSVVVGLLLMSGLAVAGGDIAPVEPEVVVPAPPPVVDDSGLYLGVAYGAARYKGDYTGQEYSPGLGILRTYSGTEKIEYDTVMGQLGYKFNQYLALEGRYWQSFGDNGWSWSESGIINGTDPYSNSDSGANGDELKAWGVYVKPMYPVTEQLDVYALLGYGNVTLSDDDNGDWLDENDFQWGLGASYEFMDNLSFFVDYVRLLDKGGSMTWENDTIGQESWDDTVYTVNVGLTYKF